MPVPVISIGVIPFALPSQTWGDLMEVSQPAWEQVPFGLPSQSWGDLAEVTYPSVTPVPFALPSQTWGDLVETPHDPIGDYYDPGSLPFVIEAALVPAPGAVDVGLGATILIPCGDRIAVSEDRGVRVLDPFLGTSQPAELMGLDPLETVLRVTIGGGAPVTVLAGGVVTPGWTVDTTLTDQAGQYRGIVGTGRTYKITPPINWPGMTTIVVDVELVDRGKKVTLYSYFWETESDFLRLDSVTGEITRQGGDEILCRGLFPIGELMTATLGGVLCYGGPGYGYTCWSKNGTELFCSGPPLPVGSYTFSVTARITTTRSIGPVLVVDRPWRTKEFSIRGCFPPWAGVGKRKITDS